MAKPMSYVERIRMAREQRIASNKAEINNERQEFLLLQNLPSNNEVWWPREATEARFRILPFIVTKEDNIYGQPVNSTATARRFKVHNLPNGRTVLCLKSLGLDCPACEKFMSFSEAERKDMNSPAQRYKAKDRVIFNALFAVPAEGGKNKLVMRVVSASYYASWQKLSTEIKNEVNVQLELRNSTAVDKIYSFDDPETGYWIEVRCNKDGIPGNNNEKSKFMQITRVDLRWREEAKPLSENVFDAIADLDRLIPEPPTADEMRRFFGLGATNETVDAYHAPEVEDDHIPMGDKADANTKAYLNTAAKVEASEPTTDSIEGELDADGFDDEDFDL
jgi:hypothetical protein